MKIEGEPVYCEAGEFVLCKDKPSHAILGTYLATHIGQISRVNLNEYVVVFYDESFPEFLAKHYFKNDGNYHIKKFNKNKILLHSSNRRDIESILVGKRFDL